MRRPRQTVADRQADSYLAGIGLNLDDSPAIYAGMLAYRRFPADIFSSAEGRVHSLREAIQHH